MQLPRPSRAYYEAEGFAAKPVPSIRRAHTTGGSHMASSQSFSSTRRSTYDNVFGFPLQQPPLDKPSRMLVTAASCPAAKHCPDCLCSVSCVVCMDDDKPNHETVKLKCGHHMCHRCLRRNFRLSLTDPQHMPPKCCTTDHIPLEHVERLFDNEFKRKWNRKFAEFSTRNRLYCPTPHCGEWIRPENIRRDAGFHHGKCSRCKTKVCCACNGRWHYPRACPRDVETDRFLEQARREGWQRCHRCNAVVELKEGCNHMTWYGPLRAIRRASAPAIINSWCPSSRCGGEFCMTCGSKWKSCDCPWFNETLEAEPADYMDMAMDPRPNPFAGSRSRFDAPKRFETPPSSPRAFRSDAGPPPPLTSSVRPRPSSYEEEMMLHRLQKRRDAQNVIEKGRPSTEFGSRSRDNDRARERPPRGIEFDRQAPPHPRRPVGDEYRRRPATVIVPPPPQMHHPMVPPPPQSAFEAPSPGMDYLGRSRGMDYASPDQWRAPSEPPFPEHGGWHARSRPPSPDGMAWRAPSRPQSPDRGRWRTRSKAQSPGGREVWRAQSVGRSIYASPERERSPSVETRRNHSRFPSRAASRAASRVPSRAPSPPETRRAPSPPASRRAPSPPMSRRAQSAAPSRRAPSQAGTRRAPSPPGSHRSPSPDRHRSRTPAKSRARTPDRRRAQTPDEGRDSSMERRLAGRFNSETRQNSPAMMGALAPIGHGHLGPVMMMPPPPPPSYAPTQHTMGPPMPMAPVPPPAATPSMRRQHTMEEEVYSPPPVSRGAVRSSERFASSGGGLTRFHEQQAGPANAFTAAGSPHAPNVRRRPPQVTRVHGHELPRPSILAGLGGPGRGLNRVSEWRNYVEPGIPDGEQPPSIVAQ